MPPFLTSSTSSSSSSKKKRPDGLERNAKSSSNISMSLRTMGRMGQSMSNMLPSKSHKEKSITEAAAEEEQEQQGTIQISNKAWSRAEEDLLEDIKQVRRAMDLFLNSRIPEAESILEPKRQTSLYHSLGHSFVLFLKSLMTFQHTDIEEAIEALKETIQLSDAFRKKNLSWIGNIASWVKGISVQDVWEMSRLHRHAELVYAESYLLKALLCIIYDESFVSFLREGLNVRASYNTYRTLSKFLNNVKDQVSSGKKEVSECGLDDHFTSGVSLGVGLFNILISLLPSSVMKVVEFIGFTSDRGYGMELLEAVGGWEEYDGLPLDQLPPDQESNEGLRRQFCDMVLMLYHIILSKLIPLSDVNQNLSDRVLAYNLKIYPDGVFFLYFSGRQLIARRELNSAKKQYQKAIDIQKDWKQLQHMCYWELGLINLLQQNWQASVDCYITLYKESNWSKAVYTYLQATSIFVLSLNDKTKSVEEKERLLRTAGEMMLKVTSAKQKIAGKSIPLEKFVARKARKFVAQGNRLLFPDLEILNAFSAFDFMSSDLLHSNLERTNKEIQCLTHETKHEEVLNYYDDLCLSHYLRAILLRLLLDQEVNVTELERVEWKQLHKESIQTVMDHAQKIQLDHYIYYFTRYEEARMLIKERAFEEAKTIIQSIIKSSDKGQFNVGAGPHAKNKYSLENTLLFKCHNCLSEIQALSSKDSSSEEHFSSAASSIVLEK